MTSPADRDGQPRQTLALYAHALRLPLLAWFRRRMKDTSEAEDMVQEVLLRVTQRGDLADVRQVDRYLFQTAASVLTDRQRRRSVRFADAHVAFDPEMDPDTSPDAHRIAESRDLLRQTAQALQELPERTRAIFLLRRVDGLKYQDIARGLGLSVSTVEKEMQKAVGHLNSAMESYP